MRARYSGGSGGEPAGRSSYERQRNVIGWVVLSFSKLEETRKQYGQTKSDQMSMWVVFI